MTPRSPRLAALIAVVITPAAALLALAFAITLGPSRSIERGPLENGEKIGRSRAWIEFSGFYPAELDNGRSFSWMGGAGRLRLARLDRSVAIKFSFWVQPAVATRPVELKVAVDGLSVLPITLVPGPQRVDIDVPAARAGRATVDLSVSETMVPGAADRRTLGLRVDGVALEAADGRIRIPWDSLRSATIAGFGLGIALGLTLGVRPLAFALGLGAGGWLGFLVAFDVAFLGAYPDRLAVVGLCTAAFGALCAAGMRGGADERWGLRAASGVLVVLTACKLALFCIRGGVGARSFTSLARRSCNAANISSRRSRHDRFSSSPTRRDSTCSSVLYGTPCTATWNTSGFSDRRSSERKPLSQLPSTRSFLPTGATGWRHAPQARSRFCFRWFLPILHVEPHQSFGQSMFGSRLAMLLCAKRNPRRGWI